MVRHFKELRTYLTGFHKNSQYFPDRLTSKKCLEKKEINCS